MLISISCGSGKKMSASRQGKPKASSAKIQAKYASQLQVPKSEIKNISLYSFIDGWLGTPHKMGDMSKTGTDCSGFCNVLYNQVYKTKLPRTTRDIAAKGKKVGGKQLKEGDLVIFNINGEKSTHVGIYLKNDYFVHASSSRGVVISHLKSAYYQRYYAKGVRFL